ncbi:hypothetical protein Tco_1176287 [Tanacetum coccineum]
MAQHRSRHHHLCQQLLDVFKDERRLSKAIRFTGPTRNTPLEMGNYSHGFYHKSYQRQQALQHGLDAQILALDLSLCLFKSISTLGSNPTSHESPAWTVRMSELVISSRSPLDVCEDSDDANHCPPCVIRVGLAGGGGLSRFSLGSIPFHMVRPLLLPYCLGSWERAGLGVVRGRVMVAVRRVSLTGLRLLLGGVWGG